MSDTPGMYGWRYTSFGTVRHLLYDGRRTAVCGMGPAWFCEWLGSGNQREYETCAVMLPCRRCVARVPEAADWQVTT